MAFDIPNIGVDFQANLGIDTPSSKTMDAINDESHIENDITRLIKVPFSAKALVGTTTFTSLENASPAMGRQVSIRRVTMSIAYSIFAAMPAADAIKFYLFSDSGIALSQGSAFNNISSTEMLWRWNQLPVLQVWGTKTVTLLYPEKAVLVIENTSGPQLDIAGQLQIDIEPATGPLNPPEGYL